MNPSAQSSPGVATSFPITRFRHVRFSGGLRCPRCEHSRVHRWGRFGWRQRYRCLGCRRTFSDFTGTPLAYLKRPDLWPRLCRHIVDPTTVRESAHQLGLHPTTAFRWRHRMLDGLLATESPSLIGRVSVDAGWFPYSEKGSRSLTRPPRRFAFAGCSFQTDVVWVVFATASSGRSAAALVGLRSPGPVALRAALEPVVARATTLLAGGGREGAVRQAARSLALLFEPEGPSSRLTARRCPEPARRHVLRVRGWMVRFHGVATKYLANYLVWFRLLDLWARPWSLRPLRDRLLAAAFP